MDFRQLQRRIMALAKKKDWGTAPDEVIFAEKIALLHGEVAEALEAYRQHRMTGKDSVAEEFADIVMRVLHLAGIYKIDVTEAIQKKFILNTR